MLIRQQDKAIIHYVALLGTVLSALGAGVVIWNLPEQRQSAIAMQNEASQEASALDKLSQAGIMPEHLHIAKAAAKELTTETVQEMPVWSFCDSLAIWQLALLSLAGATASAAISYGLIWTTMYIGSVILYIVIRRIYDVIRHLSPTMAATCGQTVTIDGQPVIQRDPTRIIPILIKLIVLMSLTLILLAVIVWQLTSFKF
jgi:hypothetical protein